MSEKFRFRDEIVSWLVQNKIRNAVINDDFTVDVLGSVNRFKAIASNIPVKFRIVHGEFDCSYTGLTSLDGSPDVVGGMFTCSGNNLENLCGAPKMLYGDFYCVSSGLKIFDWNPVYFDGSICCRFNPELGNLQNLEKLGDIKSALSNFGGKESGHFMEGIETNKRKVGRPRGSKNGVLFRRS